MKLPRQTERAKDRQWLAADAPGQTAIVQQQQQQQQQAVATVVLPHGQAAATETVN